MKKETKETIRDQIGAWGFIFLFGMIPVSAIFIEPTEIPNWIIFSWAFLFIAWHFVLPKQRGRMYLPRRF